MKIARIAYAALALAVIGGAMSSGLGAVNEYVTTLPSEYVVEGHSHVVVDMNGSLPNKIEPSTDVWPPKHLDTTY